MMRVCPTYLQNPSVNKRSLFSLPTSLVIAQTLHRGAMSFKIKLASLSQLRTTDLGHTMRALCIVSARIKDPKYTRVCIVLPCTNVSSQHISNSWRALSRKSDYILPYPYHPQVCLLWFCFCAMKPTIEFQFVDGDIVFDMKEMADEFVANCPIRVEDANLWFLCQWSNIRIRQ